MKLNGTCILQDMLNYPVLSSEGQVFVADLKIINQICHTWLNKTDCGSE